MGRRWKKATHKRLYIVPPFAGRRPFYFHDGVGGTDFTRPMPIQKRNAKRRSYNSYSPEEAKELGIVPVAARDADLGDYIQVTDGGIVRILTARYQIGMHPVLGHKYGEYKRLPDVGEQSVQWFRSKTSTSRKDYERQMLKFMDAMMTDGCDPAEAYFRAFNPNRTKSRYKAFWWAVRNLNTKRGQRVAKQYLQEVMAEAGVGIKDLLLKRKQLFEMALDTNELEIGLKVLEGFEEMAGISPQKVSESQNLSLTPLPGGGARLEASRTLIRDADGDDAAAIVPTTPTEAAVILGDDYGDSSEEINQA